MPMTDVPLRLDATIAQALKVRSTMEHRSVDAIVADALREYTSSHPVARERMLALVRAIAQEDASLLNALRDA